jgi:hypothetical protein
MVKSSRSSVVDRGRRLGRRYFSCRLHGGFLWRTVMTEKSAMNVLRSNRLWVGLLAVAGFLLCSRAPPQEFSADLVTTNGNGAAMAAGKLRVTSDKVRIETPEFADGFFLIDGAKPTAFFVRPAARTFMEARQSSRLTQVFVRVDPEAPCRAWQAMATAAGVADQGGWRCERAGEEMIDGHRAIAYRAASPRGKEFVGWIDPVRKFPLRIKSEVGATVTAQDIRDEPQPAQLFEIPTGFRKFDPQILIQRIKQSDVWVGDEKDFDRSHR